MKINGVQRFINKSIFYFVAICLFLCLTGCAKVIDVKEKEVSVLVVEEYYKPSHYRMSYVGKKKVVREPAVYSITVEYEDEKYNLTSKSAYDLYKDKVGKDVKAILKISTYDDGTITKDILEFDE